MNDNAIIQPAPTCEEAAAILAALRLVRQIAAPTPTKASSNWQRAARAEALRSETEHVIDGWRGAT